MCDKLFPTVSELNLHKVNHHKPVETAEEKSLKCEYCEFITKNKVSLNLHLETHMNQNYPWDHCSYKAAHTKGSHQN